MRSLGITMVIAFMCLTVRGEDTPKKDVNVCYQELIHAANQFQKDHDENAYEHKLDALKNECFFDERLVTHDYPIIEAVRSGRIDLFKALIEKLKVRANRCDSEGRTTVQIALALQDEEFKAFIKKCVAQEESALFGWAFFMMVPVLALFMCLERHAP